MRNLPLVDGDDHDEEADAEAADGAACVQPVDILGSGLEGSAHDENECSYEDGPSSPNVVTPRTGEGSTEEGASCE